MTILPKNKEQRVAVFIDVQNLYHSAKHLYQSRVNFREILRTAVGSRKLIRAFAYVIRTKTGEERAFFDALTNIGIETRIKDLQEYYGGLKKRTGTLVLPLTPSKSQTALTRSSLFRETGTTCPLWNISKTMENWWKPWLSAAPLQRNSGRRWMNSLTWKDRPINTC